MVRKTRKIRRVRTPSGEEEVFEVEEEEELPTPRPPASLTPAGRAASSPAGAKEPLAPDSAKRSVEQSLSLQEMVMAEIEADLVRKEDGVRSQLQVLNQIDPKKVDALLSSVGTSGDETVSEFVRAADSLYRTEEERPGDRKLWDQLRKRVGTAPSERLVPPAPTRADQYAMRERSVELFRRVLRPHAGDTSKADPSPVAGTQHSSGAGGTTPFFGPPGERAALRSEPVPTTRGEGLGGLLQLGSSKRAAPAVRPIEADDPFVPSAPTATPPRMVVAPSSLPTDTPSGVSVPPSSSSAGERPAAAVLQDAASRQTSSTPARGQSMSAKPRVQQTKEQAPVPEATTDKATKVRPDLLSTLRSRARAGAQSVESGATSGMFVGAAPEQKPPTGRSSAVSPLTPGTETPPPNHPPSSSVPETAMGLQQSAAGDQDLTMWNERVRSLQREVRQRDEIIEQLRAHPLLSARTSPGNARAGDSIEMVELHATIQQLQKELLAKTQELEDARRAQQADRAAAPGSAWAEEDVRDYLHAQEEVRIAREEIQAREARLRGNEDQLKGIASENIKSEYRLRRLETQLGQQEKQLKAQQAEVKELQDHLVARDEDLRQRDEAMHQREEELVRKEEDLQTIREQLKIQRRELDDETRQLREEVKEKVRLDHRLRRQREELDARAKESSAPDQKVEEVLRMKVAELASKEEELARRERLLAHREGSADPGSGSTGLATDDLARQKALLDKRASDLAHLEEVLKRKWDDWVATQRPGTGSSRAPTPTKGEAPPAQRPLLRVRCNKCTEPIPIYTTQRPLKVSCPSCGNVGILRR